MQDFLATCSRDDFEKLIGDVFVLSDGSTNIDLNLHSVKAHRPETERDIPVIIDGVEIPSRPAFSVAFTGPKSPWFQQGLFAVSHPDTGEMSLMLSCFSEDETGRHYEAVFN